MTICTVFERPVAKWSRKMKAELNISENKITTTKKSIELAALKIKVAFGSTTSIASNSARTTEHRTTNVSMISNNLN